MHILYRKIDILTYFFFLNTFPAIMITLKFHFLGPQRHPMNKYGPIIGKTDMNDRFSIMIFLNN